MRTILRAAIAFTGAVALSLVAVVPANAADTGADTVTVAVEAGEVTIATTGTSIALLNSGVPAAPGEVATGSIAEVTVTDLTASTTNWNVTASTTPFVNGDSTITLGDTGMTYTATEGTTTGSPVVAYETTTSPLAETVTGDYAADTAIVGTTTVDGNNTVSWAAELSITIPDQALVTTGYTATVTHSVI